MELAGKPLERRLVYPAVVLVLFALFDAVDHRYDRTVVLLVPIFLFVLSVVIDVFRERF